MGKLNENNLTESFKSCYEEYYTRVFKHAAYITGNLQAAEDIAQETFIRFYNTPPGHDNTAAWLIKVSSNLAYNFLRDEKGRKAKEPVIAEDEYSNVVSLEDLAVRNSEIRLVKRVLDSMDARDRICLLLKFSGYKYSEIADIAGVEKTSVGQILARAQEKFRKRYLKEAQA